MLRSEGAASIFDRRGSERERPHHGTRPSPPQLTSRVTAARARTASAGRRGSRVAMLMRIFASSSIVEALRRSPGAGREPRRRARRRRGAIGIAGGPARIVVAVVGEVAVDRIRCALASEACAKLAELSLRDRRRHEHLQQGMVATPNGRRPLPTVTAFAGADLQLSCLSLRSHVRPVRAPSRWLRRRRCTAPRRRASCRASSARRAA